jgi:hypothetical protein
MIQRGFLLLILGCLLIWSGCDRRREAPPPPVPTAAKKAITLYQLGRTDDAFAMLMENTDFEVDVPPALMMSEIEFAETARSDMEGMQKQISDAAKAAQGLAKEALDRAKDLPPDDAAAVRAKVAEMGAELSTKDNTLLMQMLGQGITKLVEKETP